MRRFNRLVLGIVVSVAAFSGARLHGSSTTWDLADVFVAVANGAYQIRDSTGTLKDSSLTLVTNGGTSKGCALDSSLNLYTVNATSNTVTKYLSGTTSAAQTISTLSSPQSIVFDAADNFYVGYAGGTIQKFNAAGVPQGTRTVPVDSTTALWIDLAADLRTIFYTSGGQTVRTVDFVAGTTSTFATFPPPNGPTNKSYALRLLRPRPSDGSNALIGGAIVAHGADIKLLSSTGTVVRTYDATGQDAWFGLALTPNDIHSGDRAFWAGDQVTGKLWRFKVDGTGTPELGPIAASTTIGGLCVNGEPTQGQYTQILSLSPSTLSGAATFNQGNPIEQHQFGVSFVLLNSPLRIVISAREVLADGECTANDPTDVDCGFVSFFSTDPELPQGVAYVHGRAVYYWSESLRPVDFGTESRSVTVTSVHPSADLLGPQAGFCGVNGNGQPLRRAVRLFHDPTEIPEVDQFDNDISISFFVDEWGMGGSPDTGESRYMVAFRCANGISIISRPPDGRTFSAGSSIPIEVDLFDKQGSPVTNANTDPHRIVVTIGFAGQVLNTVNTPGSAFSAFKQVQPGIYRVNLDTTGQPPSPLPYHVCINDASGTPVPSELPNYMNNCVSYFLK